MIVTRPNSKIYKYRSETSIGIRINSQLKMLNSKYLLKQFSIYICKFLLDFPYKLFLYYLGNDNFVIARTYCHYQHNEINRGIIELILNRPNLLVDLRFENIRKFDISVAQHICTSLEMTF